MTPDFTFILQCTNCGVEGETEEYMLRYECPKCKSEMRLSRIETSLSGSSLKKRLAELLSKKAQGDILSGKIFALLADSPEPAVRNIVEEVLYEKYCREHGIPIRKSAADTMQETPVQTGTKVPPRKQPVAPPYPKTPAKAHSKHPPETKRTVICPCCGQKKLVVALDAIGLDTTCPRCGEVFSADLKQNNSSASAQGNARDRKNQNGYTEVICPRCGRSKLVSDSFIGLYTTCPRCGQTFPTGTSASDPTPASALPRAGMSYLSSERNTAGRRPAAPGPGNTPGQRKIGRRLTEVTCPYCGTKKTISNSFLGLHTRCQKCFRTFPTSPA